jgi:glucose-1-phosphate thymidylyltransferase
VDTAALALVLAVLAVDTAALALTLAAFAVTTAAEALVEAVLAVLIAVLELLSAVLAVVRQENRGATIFTYIVNNPSDYGIVELDKNNKIKNILEKPKKTNSRLAITGFYLFDKNLVNFSKKLRPSKRKELEIVDLIKKYLKQNKLNAEFMGRGSAWLDTGSIENLNETAQFISSIERRQGLKIGCLEEIAYINKWISKKNIMRSIKFYGNCEYSQYLKSLVK